MFKKIEIWILYLILLLSFLFAIGFGTLVRQELIGTTKLGAVSKTALFLSEIPGRRKWWDGIPGRRIQRGGISRMTHCF